MPQYVIKSWLGSKTPLLESKSNYFVLLRNSYVNDDDISKKMWDKVFLFIDELICNACNILIMKCTSNKMNNNIQSFKTTELTYTHIHQDLEKKTLLKPFKQYKCFIKNELLLCKIMTVSCIYKICYLKDIHHKHGSYWFLKSI